MILFDFIHPTINQILIELGVMAKKFVFSHFWDAKNIDPYIEA